MAFVWDNSMMLKLIDAYKKHEVLWNTKHEKYKHNRNLKLDEWKKVADELGLDTAVAEQKMHNLRSQFTREYRRVLAARENGDELVPSWFAYDSLTFLIEHTISKPKKAPFKRNTAKPRVSSPLKDPLELNSEGNEGSSHMSQDESKYMQFFDDSKDSSENARNFINCEPTYTPPAKKQKTDKDGDPIVESSRSQDDCALFADYMATEMRKIKDEAIIASVKHKISSIIFESQMKYFEDVKNKSKRNETSPPHSNSYSEKDFRTSIELVPIKSEIEID